MGSAVPVSLGALGYAGEGRRRQSTRSVWWWQLLLVAALTMLPVGVAVKLEDHSCYTGLDAATATQMNCYNKGLTGEWLLQSYLLLFAQE